jgi:hypothetical protein
MTQTLKTQSWYSEMEHLSGIATISQTVENGLGSLHLRVQVEDQELRFMFSAEDFSRLISGKMIRGYDRDDFDEEVNPVIAKRLGNYAMFEAYGIYSYHCRFSDLSDLWSFKKDHILISGKYTMTRSETLVAIAKNAMTKLVCPDRYPCRKPLGSA